MQVDSTSLIISEVPRQKVSFASACLRACACVRGIMVVAVGRPALWHVRNHCWSSHALLTAGPPWSGASGGGACTAVGPLPLVLGGAAKEVDSGGGLPLLLATPSAHSGCALALHSGRAHFMLPFVLHISHILVSHTVSHL